MNIYFYDTYFMDCWTYTADQTRRDKLRDAELDMLRYSGLNLGLSKTFSQDNKDVLEIFGNERMKCFPHQEECDDSCCFENYDKALSALMQIAPKDKTQTFVWSAYKYEALGKSERVYRMIRKALSGNGGISANNFNQHLNNIKKLPFDRGQSVNMFTHIYGHFKKYVTPEEKESFLFILDAYATGKESFETVLERLIIFQNRYVDRFLHRATLFRNYGNNLISM